jgi:hypothetical protein
VPYGPPGVGKTLSARQYAHWDTITAGMMDRFGAFPDPFEDRQDADPGPAILAETGSVLWTPTVTVSPRQLDHHVPLLCRRLTPPSSATSPRTRTSSATSARAAPDRRRG